MHTLPTHRPLRRIAVLSLFVGALLAVVASPVQARFYQVPYNAPDSLQPDGRCSLREAIQASQTRVAKDTCLPGDAGWNEIEITGDVAGAVDLLLSDPIKVTSSLSIYSASGPGFYRKIRGNNTRFMVQPGASLEVSRLRFTAFQVTPFTVQGLLRDRTFVRGSLVMSSVELVENLTKSLPQTMGILVDQGSLSLHNVFIGNNYGGLDGGGILNHSGIINLSSVTIHNNYVSRYGGAIYTVGRGAKARLFNCTLSWNQANSKGGGIYHADGSTEIAFTTITRNDSPSGSGVEVVSGSFRPRKTIISFNYQWDCTGAFTSQGYNLLGRCADVAKATTDRREGNIDLEALRVPSGSDWMLTPHHPPHRHSSNPVIDAIPLADCEGAPDDQIYKRRGIGGACDIGAIEAQ